MRNKPVLATISLLFLAFSVYAGVLFFDSLTTDSRSLAASIPTISITTDEVSYPVNVNFAVTLKLDTANKPVDNIETVLSYDPSTLTALTITPLQTYKSQVISNQEIDTKKGVVNLSLAPAPGTTPDSITGSIAIIVFQAKKAGATRLELDPASKVSLKPGNTNILESLLPLTITITP